MPKIQQRQYHLKTSKHFYEIHFREEYKPKFYLIENDFFWNMISFYKGLFLSSLFFHVNFSVVSQEKMKWNYLVIKT